MKNSYIIPLVLIGNAIYIQWINFEGPRLVWNMLLGVITYYIILLANLLKSRSTLLSGLATLAWFFFFPNTFYMLTDKVHMDFITSILGGEQSLNLYFAYISSIVLGIYAGIESVKLFVKTYPLAVGKGKLVFLAGLSFLSSLAIHIGRYARLNSWDIVMDPCLVLKEIVAVFSQDGLGFVLGFTLLQFWILLFATSKEG